VRWHRREEPFGRTRLQSADSVHPVTQSFADVAYVRQNFLVRGRWSQNDLLADLIMHRFLNNRLQEFNRAGEPRLGFLVVMLGKGRDDKPGVGAVQWRAIDM
jgi:hypothetical protein